MQGAGEGRGDGFGDSMGLTGISQICLYFVLETHALDFTCFSPTSHLLQWERVREEL